MFPGIVHPRTQVKSLMNKMYQSNWRILVICIASMDVLRSFLSATEALGDLKVDNAQNNLQLASTSGTIYCLVRHRALRRPECTSQKPCLHPHLRVSRIPLRNPRHRGRRRLDCCLLYICVQECVALTTAGQRDSKSLFRTDPWPAPALSSDEALTHCLDAWSAELISQVVDAFVFYLLPSAVYCAVAYIYFCQTLDVAHSASLTARGSAIRLEARGEAAPYNPLRSPQNTRVQPKRRTTVLPRSYQTAAGVAVAPVASLSPGPPSFSVARIADPSIYQVFRLSAGSEDDTFI
ncbi:hypothetical protein B0H17DRAFT_12154 [Mycena rosella]|uniref:Uncharacterized protein n=1 Tax=Mycena rosella TaxID=1033263 RepID=A0AAD7GSQ6_MYCRO|nr:hypothetical protein B0H17DRAFT_12154 [Mycena rosella]